MSHTIGVDLGTTWTAAAVLDNEADGARPEPVMLTSRSMAMPSIVALEDGELVAGESAERLLSADPTVGAREFKRRLGDETPYIIGTTPMGAEALMAGVLKATIGHPGLAAATEDGVENVVLTHPANWGDYKLDLVREIARLAGVERFDLLAEPAAAAISYAVAGQLTRGQTVAVYDFGGGTFDAAVVELGPDGPRILGQPEGLERLGGIDLDQAVLRHIDQSLGEVFASLDRDDVEVRNGLVRLRSACTVAKEALSSETEVSIPVSLPGISTEVRLTRSEFEGAVGPRLDDTFTALDRAIASAGLTPSDLDGTLLVGGSSRFPLVAERLAAHTERPVLTDADPKLAVALGAAARHHYEAFAAGPGPADGGPAGDPDRDSTAESGGEDGSGEGTHRSPTAIAQSIKVDPPKRPAKVDQGAKRRATAKKVGGGIAAAGAAAAAAGVAAAAVADAGPLAGIGPLDGDFDLGEAAGGLADQAKSAFGFGSSEEEPTGPSSDLEGEFDRAAVEQIASLMGDDDLDELSEPAGPTAAGLGDLAGQVGGAGSPAGSAPPSMAAPAGPAQAAAVRAPIRQAAAQPPMPPPSNSQPSQPARPPAQPARPEAPQAPATNPELEAVRAQLQQRLENWEQPDGVTAEDAAELREDLGGLLERFEHEPGLSIDNAIAGLKYEFENRMRDFAQDQKLDALIEQQEQQAPDADQETPDPDPAETDDDDLVDVFDEAETGEHDVQLTKEIRIPEEDVDDDELFDDVVAVDVGQETSADDDSDQPAEPSGDEPEPSDSTDSADSPESTDAESSGSGSDEPSGHGQDQPAETADDGGDGDGDDRPDGDHGDDGHGGDETPSPVSDGEIVFDGQSGYVPPPIEDPIGDPIGQPIEFDGQSGYVPPPVDIAPIEPEPEPQPLEL